MTRAQRNEAYEGEDYNNGVYLTQIFEGLLQKATLLGLLNWFYFAQFALRFLEFTVYTVNSYFTYIGKIKVKISRESKLLLIVFQMLIN